MKKYRNIIISSVIIALSSQINIGFLGTDFRVSGGIIFFSILLYVYKDLKPIPTGIVSGVTVYLFRLLILFLGRDNIGEAI